MEQNDTVTSYTALRKKASQKLIPLHCLFELTYRCNLNCVHCYIARKDKWEMDKYQVFRTLEQLKEAECLYLTFSGGEPLLRNDFFEIANYACKLNFAIRIFTNGTLINKDIADRIKGIKPLSIEISLYGFKDTHEKITRVEDSFDKAINAIKLLKERNLKVFVKAMLMRDNVDEIWKLKKFVEENLGAKMRGFGGGILLSPCDDGNRRPLNYRLSDEQLRDYIEEEFKQLESLGEEYRLREIQGNETLCGTGFGSCNITPYGEVNPCVQIRLKNNDLKDKSFIDIWKNHEGINRIRNLRMQDRRECQNCEYLPYCFVCPGIALLEEGSLTAKLPEACRQAKIRKEVYEEIREKEKTTK